MSIYTKLAKIQQEMKAPKNLYNSFGKYNYRNAESILEAFKPFEEKYNVTLIISDDVVNIGDRYYIKANATLIDNEDEKSITVSALAREDEHKTGMDSAQQSGACSSYARKYCLNGLLLLDDTKDADTDEYVKQTKSEKKAEKPNFTETNKKPASDAQKNLLIKRVANKGFELEEVLEKYHVSMDTLTNGEARQIIADFV